MFAFLAVLLADLLTCVEHGSPVCDRLRATVVTRGALTALLNHLGALHGVSVAASASAAPSAPVRHVPAKRGGKTAAKQVR